MKKHMMVTESQIDALMSGQTILCTPLPFNPEREETFAGAKGVYRFVPVTSVKVAPGRYELTRAE